MQILGKLIELSEVNNGMILKEELQFILDSVEKERNKIKDKQMEAIKKIVKNLVGKFDSSKIPDSYFEKGTKEVRKR